MDSTFEVGICEIERKQCLKNTLVKISKTKKTDEHERDLKINNTLKA